MGAETKSDPAVLREWLSQSEGALWLLMLSVGLAAVLYPVGLVLAAVTSLVMPTGLVIIAAAGLSLISLLIVSWTALRRLLG